MATIKLVLTDDNEEVYQADSKVEVSFPAIIDNALFIGAIGITVTPYYDNPYIFTITKKGMEEIISFYQENKHKIGD